MTDIIDRNTMEIHRSVNTPDYTEPEFMVINGKTLPLCENKYWKIVDDEIVEMSTEEKVGVDYVAPPPEPTVEELEIRRKQKTISRIREKYSPDAEFSILRRLGAGKVSKTDPEFIEYDAWAEGAIAEFKQV